MSDRTTSSIGIAVATAIQTSAEKWNVILDLSKESLKSVEILITSVEQVARVALDLPDDARVSDDVSGMLDFEALGAYYGELLVRHAGGEWGEVHWEGRSQFAVRRGRLVIVPAETIHRRVFDGKQGDLLKWGRHELASLAKQKLSAVPGTSPVTDDG